MFIDENTHCLNPPHCVSIVCRITVTSRRVTTLIETLPSVCVSNEVSLCGYPISSWNFNCDFKNFDSFKHLKSVGYFRSK